MTGTLIEISDLHAYYGQSHVLRGVNLRIGAGEAVGLLGRNGMGKTTLIRGMLRLMRATTGRIVVRGRDCSAERPDRVARMGIGYVPEGRGIFPNLSVRENLLMAARPGVRGQADWTFERVLETFPRLAERLHHGGNQLSGGEQQMLAIGRALIARPTLMLLDEPSLGLSPLLVENIFAIIARINAEQQVSMLLVEQNASVALAVAHYGYIMEMGKVVIDGSSERLAADQDVREFYLGMGGAGEARSFRDVKHYKRRKRWLS